MKVLLAATLFTLLTLQSFAQYPGGGRAGGGNRFGGQMNMGHFYGKMVDGKTNKGIAGVSIQLKGNKFDTITKQLKEVILKTVITENNGDFSLEGLMVFGNFKFKATAVGYKTFEKQISFGIKRPDAGAAPDAAAMQQMANLADKDLGNFKMDLDETNLAEVTVTASAKQQFELGVDRKIFNVDKSLTAAGQTASELMKSIPSVSVDIDGNVSLRNAAPTIFVDGRPTTLTLDQIPVEIIDKVEIITNPSAKFDASGGNAGILNIVLKKNKKNGYNGNLRAGIDSRAKVNLGGDISLRQNKINFTASANFNQRKSISHSLNNTTLFTKPNNSFVQSNDEQTNNGYFSFFRTGIDYFIDNRNTITVNGNFNKGNFKNDGLQTIDSTPVNSTTTRNTYTDFSNQSFGGQLSFRHNFAGINKNLTGDINYNSSNSDRATNINSNNKTSTNPYAQNTDGKGINKFLTIQSDYENQITENTKFEAGVRAAIRDFETENYQYVSNQLNTLASNRYKFNDNVYAAYSTYSFKIKKTSFQLGLRAESSDYTGTLQTLSGADSTKFNIKYPLSLFPSTFITHKLTDKQDLQLNYSRRVNRPNFYQLLPSYDFTDPQNPSVGNPNLKPEFTHSFELSYNNAYKRQANFLATIYFKYSENLITRYIYKDIDRNNANATDSLYYGSYINANTSFTYGLELTEKLPVNKWWDLMLNFNLYNTNINATIPNQSINNSLASWFTKINSTFKIAKGLSLQITWENRSKTIIPQSGGGGRMYGGGGGMFGGGSQTLAQGYTLPRNFDIDVALRKEWTWKNGQSGSLNLSMNDIFASRVKTETNAIFFSQNTERYRDPQVVRLNFNYRFGKLDMNLFKRKNTKAEQGGGMDMMGQ